MASVLKHKDDSDTLVGRFSAASKASCAQNEAHDTVSQHSKISRSHDSAFKPVGKKSARETPQMNRASEKSSPEGVTP